MTDRLTYLVLRLLDVPDVCANHHLTDIESALDRKWFKYRDESADPQVVNQ